MIRMLSLPLIVIVSFIMIGFSAQAIVVEQKLENPAFEAVAVQIFKKVRCVKCTSESVHDSKTQIAQDLRHTIRQRILAGDTSTQILDYLRARYGDEILMEPPVDEHTQALWFMPAVLLMLGCLVVLNAMKHFRRLKRESEES